MPDNIIVTQPEDGVGVIQLNRPQQRNALNQQTYNELEAALVAFREDDTVRCVVITGSEKAFAAGSDVTEMQGQNAVEAEVNGAKRLAQWEVLRTYPKPLIAAVNGYCLGGGNELALACDMIIAGENARFGQPEINLALMPGAGGTQRLTRTVGKVIAMEMVLAGRFLSADEALRFRLVNVVVPVEDTLETALYLARKVAAKAPLAVQKIKAAVLEAFELPLAEGLRHERSSFYSLFGTEDTHEGISAFLEKRDPEWKGR
ncbi:MAG: enoyl-CoA hydratase-related protein [Chloroflexota bacterium]